MVATTLGYVDAVGDMGFFPLLNYFAQSLLLLCMKIIRSETMGAVSMSFLVRYVRILKREAR